MRKKSVSLQKLPQINRIKKQKLQQKATLFDSQMHQVQRQELHNRNVQLALKHISKKFDPKELILLSKELKKRSLAPIQEIKPKQQSNFIQKINVNQKLFLNTMQISNNQHFKHKIKLLFQNKNVQKTQIQITNKKYSLATLEQKNQLLLLEPPLKKQMLPYYTVRGKQQLPFQILKEYPENFLIRFINGVQKTITNRCLYGLQKKHQQEACQQTNIQKSFNQSNDALYLNKMLTRVFRQKNPRKQIQQILRQSLNENYLFTVNNFKQIYNRLQNLKKKIPTSNQHKYYGNLQSLILNTKCLGFLSQFLLSKHQYIRQLIKAYEIIHKLQNFNHFQFILSINTTEKFIDAKILMQKIQKKFKMQKDTIDLVVYQVQQQLQSICIKMTQDIERVIKLNPRLENINYTQSVIHFLKEWSLHCGRILRSTLISTINKQLFDLSIYFNNLMIAPRYLTKELLNKPDTFDNCVYYKTLKAINQPLCVGQTINVHYPGIIPLKLSLKKCKRVKNFNIYKLLLTSRSKIRQYMGNQKEKIIRITYQSVSLHNVLSKQIELYINNVSESENVNGCISNQKIDIGSRIQTKSFRMKVEEINASLEETIKIHVNFWGLFEYYLMQKPYIDQLIDLFKRINSVPLLKQQLVSLEQDRVLVQSLPQIFEYKMIRLDVKQIKQKVLSIIRSNFKRGLKASEDTLQRVLEFGANETIKAQRLNQVDPFSNVQEYKQFLLYLNNKQIEYSINNITSNAFIIEANYSLLSFFHHDIKPSLFQSYLSSTTWVRKIREAHKQNQAKKQINPHIFMKSIKEKKTKIFFKYSKMLKDIVQLMKIQDLTQIDKCRGIAQAVNNEMIEICTLVQEISSQENVLELKYQPQMYITNKQSVDQETQNSFKCDLMFFIKEQAFLKKYFRFWSYAAKLRDLLDVEVQRPIVRIDGIQFVRILREGQQLLWELKASTLNKRFLGLCDGISSKLEQHLKYTQILLLAGSGTEQYRIKVIKDICSQLGCKNDSYEISIKTLIQWEKDKVLEKQKNQTEEQNKFINNAREQDKLQNVSKIQNKTNSMIQTTMKLEFTQQIKSQFFSLKKQQIKNIQTQLKKQNLQILNKEKKQITLKTIHTLDYKKCYKLQQQEEQMSNLQKELNAIPGLIRSCEWEIFFLFIKEQSKSYEFLKINCSVFDCCEYLNIKINDLIKQYNNNILDEDNLLNIISKKINIFTRSLNKLNQASQKISSYHSLISLFKDFYPEYSVPYQTLLHDFRKKTDLVSKLGFFTLYDDRVKINYDQEIKALELFKNKIQKQIIALITEDSSLRFHLMNIFCNLHSFKSKLCQPLINHFCQSGNFDIKFYEGKYILMLQSIQTVYNEQVQCKIQETFWEQRACIKCNKVCKECAYERCGVLKIIKRIKQKLHQVTQKQTINLVSNVYECHFKISQLFQLYLAVSNCLFQSLLHALTLVFYMDLKIVINNEYDRSLLYSKIQQGMSFVPREPQNMIYSSTFYLLSQHFLSIIRYHDPCPVFNVMHIQLPQVLFQKYDNALNKKWLNDIKKQKEDDFILQTHYSPAFLALQLPRFAELQSKQVQIKQPIQNIFNNSLHQLNSFPNILIKCGEYNLPFQCGTMSKFQTRQFSAERGHVSHLLIKAAKTKKILITNLHPSFIELGIGFIKCNKFINSQQNIAVTVHSLSEVVFNLRNMHNKLNLSYIYYQEYDGKYREENSIGYCLDAINMEVILTKQLNGVERNFIISHSQLQVQPYKRNSLIQSYRMYFQINLNQKDNIVRIFKQYQQDIKKRIITKQNSNDDKMSIKKQQKQLFNQQQLKENENNDLSQQQSQEVLQKQLLQKIWGTQNKETLINFLTYPVYGITDLNQLKEQIIPIANYVLKNLKQTDVQSIQIEQVQLFIFPVHEMNLQQRYKLVKKILENDDSLINFKVTNNNKGPKWYVLDIKCERQIYSFIVKSLLAGEYVFDNYQTYSTQIHFQQRVFQTHSFKCILLKNDYQQWLPFPVLKLQVFNPLRQFYKQMPSKLAMFKNCHQQLLSNNQKEISSVSIKNKNTEFLDFNLVKIKSLGKIVQKMLKKLSLKYFNRKFMQQMMNFLCILINELRKRQLAKGNYYEKQLTSRQSLKNIFGSCDLRQKTRMSHIQLVELQQIQRKLEQQRKDIYKSGINFTIKGLKFSSIKETHQQKQILEPIPFSRKQLKKDVQNLLYFSIYYTLLMQNQNEQQFIKEFNIINTIFKGFTKKINLHKYYYSLKESQWLLWETINNDFVDCNISFTSKSINARQIMRLWGSNNRNVKNRLQQKNFFLTIKHPIASIIKLKLIYGINCQFKYASYFFNQLCPLWSFLKQLNILFKNIQKPIFQFAPANAKMQKMLNNIASKKKKIIYTNNFSLMSFRSYQIFKDKQNIFRINKNVIVLIIPEQAYKAHFNLYEIAKITNFFNEFMIKPFLSLLSLQRFHQERTYKQILRMKRTIINSLNQKDFLSLYGFYVQTNNYNKFEEQKHSLQNQTKIFETIEEQQTQMKIQKINILLNSFMNNIQIKKSYVNTVFVPRYLFKKKKIIKVMDQIKEDLSQKQQKQISLQKKNKKKHLTKKNIQRKIQYNDIIQKQTNSQLVVNENMSQIIVQMQLNEPIILIEGTKCSTLQWVLCWKIYLKAQLTAQYKSRLFAVNVLECEKMTISYTQNIVYSEIDLTKISFYAELTFVHLHKKQLFQALLSLAQIYNKGTTIIVCDKIICQGYSVLKLKEEKQDHLLQIQRSKQQILSYKLKELIKRHALYLINFGVIGKQYLEKCKQKAQEIIRHQKNVKQALQIKESVLLKLSKQKQQLLQSILKKQSQQNQINLQLKIIQKQETQWKYKQKLFNGQLFEENRRKIQKIQRKQMQKQLCNSGYLQDNSFNLSYIFIFNILVDGNYFIQKTSALLQQQYKLEGNYQINQQQRKLFLKHINYGRLNALIESQQLKEAISSQQLIICNALRTKFIYLQSTLQRIVDNTWCNEPVIDEKYFSLKWIAQQQLQLIQKYSSNPFSVLFNSYVSLYFLNLYTKYLIKTKLNEIHKKRQQRKINATSIVNQLQINCNTVKQLQKNFHLTTVKHIQNKKEYMEAIENKSNFFKGVDHNIEMLSSLYVHKILGVQLFFQFKFEQWLKKQNYQEAQAITQQQFQTNIIDEKVEIIYTLTQYMITHLNKINRRQLTNNQCHLILHLTNVQLVPQTQVGEFQHVSKLQQNITLLNAKQIKQIPQIYQKSCLKLLQLLEIPFCSYNIQQNQEPAAQIVDARKYNVYLLYNNHSLDYLLQSELHPDITKKPQQLIARMLDRKKIIDSNFNRFTEKIQYVQPKNSLLINRFYLTVDNVQTVRTALDNALKNIYQEYQEKKKQLNALNLVLKVKNRKNRQYFVKLIGMICRKVGYQYAQRISLQLIYDHSFYKKKNHKNQSILEISLFKLLKQKLKNDKKPEKLINVQEQVNITQKQKQNCLQQTFQIKQEFLIKQQQIKQNNKYVFQIKNNFTKIQNQSDPLLGIWNTNCTLQTLLQTNLSIMIISGNYICEKIIERQSQKQKVILKRYQKLCYIEQSNHAKMHWQLFKINSIITVQDAQKLINSLKIISQRCLKQEIIHVKYCILLPSYPYPFAPYQYFNQHFQPTYYFQYASSLFSVLYYSNILNLSFQYVIHQIAMHYCQFFPSSYNGQYIFQTNKNVFTLQSSLINEIFFQKEYYLTKIEEIVEIINRQNKIDQNYNILRIEKLFFNMLKSKKIQKQFNQFDQFKKNNLKETKISIEQRISNKNLQKINIFAINLKPAIKVLKKRIQVYKNKNKQKQIYLNNYIHSKNDQSFQQLLIRAKIQTGNSFDLYQVELRLKGVHKLNFFGVQFTQKIAFDDIKEKESFEAMQIFNEGVQFILRKKSNRNNSKYIEFIYKEEKIFVNKEDGEGKIQTIALQQYKLILPLYSHEYKHVGILYMLTNLKFEATNVFAHAIFLQNNLQFKHLYK